MRPIILVLLLLCSVSSYSSGTRLSLRDCVELYEHGQKEQAIITLLEIYDTMCTSSSWDEDEFALTVNLIANYYSSKGELIRVSDLCRDATRIFNIKSNNPNTEFSRFLFCLRGQVEMELKDYDNALIYLQRAQQMYENESIYNNAYFGILTSIGLCYYNKGDFVESKLYVSEAEVIHLKHIGSFETSKLPYSFQLLNLKGLLKQHDGDPVEAEHCFKRAIESSEGNQILTEIRNIVANNLATLYASLGRYTEAKEMYTKINFSNPSWDYTKYQNMAFCSLMEGENDNAIDYLRSSNCYGFEYLGAVVNNYAAVEREHFWQNIANQLVKNNNFFAMWTNIPSARKAGFEINSFARDFNLNFQQLIKNQYLSSQNDIKQRVWDDYQRNRGNLSYGFETIEEHDSIALNTISLERDILSSIDLDIAEYFTEHYNTEVISKRLADNELIIDYIHMSMLNCGAIQMGSEPGYATYLLSSTNHIPLLAPICKQTDLISIMNHQLSDAEYINSIYTTYNDSIYKLIINPIIPYLEGKSRIYIRPIGLLSSINLEAIKLPDGRYFGDAYDICIVSNFDNLPKSEYQRKLKYSDIALFGNPDFMCTPSNAHSELAFTVPASPQYELMKRGGRGNWEALPGTLTEVNNISAVASNKNVFSLKFVGPDATETMVKSLSGNSPTILHFATHGYFIKSKNSLSQNNFLQQTTGYSWGNHLMLYSGLLFSGANAVWNGKTKPNPIDDGVLTADEISRLDFSNTKLVVLSACDSGRGHQNGIDGTMGLQRAFREAGAGTMVMSLWQIPDDATSLLMQYFYGHLFSNHSVRESLRLAQADLRQCGYLEPYYWAAFVVLD